MTVRSAWGLSVSLADQRTWVLAAGCRNSDPRLFDVIGRTPTAENEIALELCAGCPVRAECRDDYLSAGRRPLGLIAGGWWWDNNGKAHPYLPDVGPAVAPPRRKVTVEPRVNEHVRGTRKAITAARAKMANPGLTYKVAAARYGTNFRAVCDAVFIGRHAPDLLHPVWDGRRTLAAAFAEANRRRHDSSRQLEASAAL